MDTGSTPEEKTTRKHIIFEAAQRIFLKHGYHGTSMNMIANASGCSKKSLYLYYRSKDDLFGNVILDGLQRFYIRLINFNGGDRKIENIDSVKMILDDLFSLYSNFARDNKGYFVMTFSEATPEIIGNAPLKTQQQIYELTRACIYKVVQVIEMAIKAKIIAPLDPWEVASVFISAGTGNIVMSMGMGITQPLFSTKAMETMSRKAMRIILRGLLIDPGPVKDLL